MHLKEAVLLDLQKFLKANDSKCRTDSSKTQIYVLSIEQETSIAQRISQIRL